MDLPKSRGYLHWIFTARRVVPLLAMVEEGSHFYRRVVVGLVLVVKILDQI